MRSSRSQLLLVTSLLVLSSAPSFAAKALVWSVGNPAGNTAGVADNIRQSGCFTTVDWVNSGPTLQLSGLLNYDAVFFFANNGAPDPVQIGNVLADYADTGRRLVICTFAYAGSSWLSGRIVTGQMAPLLGINASLYSNVTMASNDGSVYFTNVNALSGFNHDDVILVSGAWLKASWSDGRPLVAQKGNVVGINLFPDDFWGQIGGDYRFLFQNAMCSYAEAVAVPGPATAPERLQLAVSSNPLRSGGAFRITLATREPARLDVLDTAGRRVFEQAIDGGPGVQSVPWPLERERAGVYFVSVTQGSERVARRVAVVH